MYRTFLFFGLFLFNLASSQQIIFTAKNASDEDVFWKTTLTTPTTLTSLTGIINQHAVFPGKNKGPICTSHNGNFYVFQSERFDDKIDGYEAITICNSGFTAFEVPKDATGAAFHSEGIMQISNDGRTIFFVQGGGKHNRDIYKITKGVSAWSDPIELTAGSTFAFNLAPYLAYDETKILFEASNSAANSTAILEVSVNGNSLATKTSTTAIPGSVQIKSPCYDINGNIYFEAETDAERVWKISANGGAPAAVHAAFTNDNSPITLPDGKIASLFLPASTHQIKVMDGTGLNDRMLTQSTSEFTEVLDIGISSGDASGSGIRTIESEREAFQLRKLNNEGVFEFHFNAQVVNFKVFNTSGHELEVRKLGETRFCLPHDLQGFYLLRINDNHGKVFCKSVFLN